MYQHFMNNQTVWLVQMATTLPRGYSDVNVTISTQSIVKTALFAFLGIVGTFCNLFNLVAIYQSPALWSLNNAILIALTTNDLFSGCIGFPLQIAAIYIHDQTICNIQATIVTIFNVYSLSLTVGLSIDRCHAVLAPYDYMRKSTAKKYAFLIIAPIFSPIAVAILPLLKLEKYGLGYNVRTSACWLPMIVDSTNITIMTLCFVMIVITSIIISICYVILFYIAYNKTSQSDQISAGNNSIKTSVRTVLLIVGTNIICWIPFTIASGIGVIQYMVYGTSLIIHKVLADIILDLSCCNVALNPIVYLLTNSILRRKFKKVFHCFFFKHRIEPCPNNLKYINNDISLKAAKTSVKHHRQSVITSQCNT